MNKIRNLLAAGTLIGDSVYTPRKEHVGKIEELMISLKDGKVSYAVMSFGGILGFGNKFFAIPWGLLRVDQENKCFILNLEKERLRTAPGFDKDHWPDTADPRWEKLVTDYYREKTIA